MTLTLSNGGVSLGSTRLRSGHGQPEHRRKPHRRARRPPQCRQVHAVQSVDRHPARHRRADCRHHARRHRRRSPSGRARTSRSSTPAACSAPARIRCTSSWCSRDSARSRTADLIVFVVDGRDGLVPGDEEIAAAAAASRRAGRARGQQDGRSQRARAGALEFYALGFDPVVEITAEHGAGVGDLLDAVARARCRTRRRVGARRRRAPAETDGGDRRPSQRRQVVAGQPAAASEERMIVSEMPGTTRDPVDSILKWHKQQFRIVDTAGIRRAGRGGAVGRDRDGQRDAGAPRHRARRRRRAGDRRRRRADRSGRDDRRRGRARPAAASSSRSNKWDLIEGSRRTTTIKHFDENMRQQLKFLDYAPILHISAATGERTPKLLETIDRVAKARADARADRRAEPVRRGGHRGARRR